MSEKEALQDVADTWFAGDIEVAKQILYALPYSTIPSSQDVGFVMEVLVEQGVLRAEELHE